MPEQVTDANPADIFRIGKPNTDGGPNKMLDKMLDGEVYKITAEEVQGAGTNGVESFRTSLRTAAYRRDLKIRTRLIGSDLYVQVIDPQES